MSCVKFSWILYITLVVHLLFTHFKICNADSSEYEDFQSVEMQRTPHRRKSPRMAFMEETEDPMFKFLTKILSTAQLRSKSALARAQNRITKTRELENEVEEVLKRNHIPIIT